MNILDRIRKMDEVIESQKVLIDMQDALIKNLDHIIENDKIIIDAKDSQIKILQEELNERCSNRDS